MPDDTTCQCWKCKKVGYAIDEFTSPYTGLCAKCNSAITAKLNNFVAMKTTVTDMPKVKQLPGITELYDAISDYTNKIEFIQEMRQQTSQEYPATTILAVKELKQKLIGFGIADKFDWGK